MKKFLVYALRWQSSFIVMYPVMLALPIQNYALKLVAANIVGAIVYFQIDKRIMNDTQKIQLTVK